MNDYATMHDTNSIIQPHRLKRLLRRVVDIYSPSGKEEELLHFLRGYLKRQGLPVVSQHVDDNRFNLVLLPKDSDIQLALIGHLDTVAAYDLEEYGYKEDEDQIKGLGAADMKAGCAAMIEAYLSLWESGSSQFPVALCLVVGEEKEGDGIEHLIKDYDFPWAVVGEPTDLRPCLSHYGYLEVQFRSLGKRRHASLANMIKNPIETMMHLILQVSHYLENERSGMVYNIRDLYSTPGGFVVPDRCEAWLDIHLPPGSPIGEIATDLEEIVDKKQAENELVELTFRIETIDAGYVLPEKGPFVEALKSVFEKTNLAWKPQAFVSHSDANKLWAAGVKPIILGPGSLEKAHAPDESVSFLQVCFAAELYRNLLIIMSL